MTVVARPGENSNGSQGRSMPNLEFCSQRLTKKACQNVSHFLFIYFLRKMGIMATDRISEDSRT